MGSLASFLTHHGSWDRTATDLGVHRHTVRHRMRKVEELTGLRLDDPEDRLLLHLGVLAASAGSARIDQTEPVTTPLPLDDTSKGIIALLQQDGRMSYAAIAKEVGLSEAAVRQRAQRLIEQGVIQIVAVTDPLELGFAWEAMVGVRVSGNIKAIADALGQIEAIDFIVLTSGKFDIILEVVAKSDDQLIALTNTIPWHPRCRRVRDHGLPEYPQAGVLVGSPLTFPDPVTVRERTGRAACRAPPAQTGDDSGSRWMSPVESVVSAPLTASQARSVSWRYAGFCASGQLDSLTQTVSVRRLTYTSWPWIPMHNSTSPYSPTRNQNWLRYQPPGNVRSAGDSTNAVRTSASTAHAWRSQRGGRTVAAAAFGDGHRPAPAAAARTGAGPRSGRAEPAVVDSGAERGRR